MARINKEFKGVVRYKDEEITFTLREPSNEELNTFLASRLEIGKRKDKVKDRTHEARCAFFDFLLVGVENLEDAEGVAITPQSKELIPANWKSAVIFERFETEEIEIKN